MEILYEKYTFIQKFIKDYRKYKLEGEFLDFATFKKTIQIEQYILHKCINIKKGRSVYIYFFKENSKYVKTTQQFKRLMDKIPEEPVDVIILTKVELSIYINKSLAKYTHFNVFNYMHKYFTLELSKGPLCSKHTILSNNEVRSLCSRELIIHPLSLPSISINDPQNIWIGGELGQVIEIISVSEITGTAIRYRIVSPDSGKMINVQKLRKHIQDHDDAQILEDGENLEEKDKIDDERKDDTVNEYAGDIIESDESDNDFD